jgi:formylmethanofuran dehydrogenase subunit E
MPAEFVPDDDTVICSRCCREIFKSDAEREESEWLCGRCWNSSQNEDDPREDR